MRHATHLIAAGVVFGLAAPCAAAPSVAAAFGNTVKATYPDGRFQRYWIKPDGTWRAIGRRGHPSSGKWNAAGDHVCLRQTHPFPSPAKYCTTFPAQGKVGASWPAKDMGGHPIRLSIVRGRI